MQNNEGSFRRQGFTRCAFKICSVCSENPAGTKRLNQKSSLFQSKGISVTHQQLADEPGTSREGVAMC